MRTTLTERRERTFFVRAVQEGFSEKVMCEPEEPEKQELAL